MRFENIHDRYTREAQVRSTGTLPVIKPHTRRNPLRGRWGCWLNTTPIVAVVVVVDCYGWRRSRQTGKQYKYKSLPFLHRSDYLTVTINYCRYRIGVLVGILLFICWTWMTFNFVNRNQHHPHKQRNNAILSSSSLSSYSKKERSLYYTYMDPTTNNNNSSSGGGEYSITDF